MRRRIGGGDHEDLFACDMVFIRCPERDRIQNQVLYQEYEIDAGLRVSRRYLGKYGAFAVQWFRAPVLRNPFP